MIRRKIQCIAEDLGYSLSQYFILAIYNTIQNIEHKDRDDIKLDKLVKLKKLLSIIGKNEKLMDLERVIDYKQYRALQMF